MKNNIILYYLISLFIILTGCESLEDTYREFVGEGETVYVAKADSIQTRSGKNRIELSWLLLSDPKVASYKVYWNNMQDSITNTVTKTANVDTVKIMLNNMPENMYHFDIYMYDKLGNSSIKASTSGKVYGKNYEATLLSRTYKNIDRDDTFEHIIVNWGANEETMIRTELRYININGDWIEKSISYLTEQDTLFNFPLGGTLYYNTVFLPEPTALDTFSKMDSIFIDF